MASQRQLPTGTVTFLMTDVMGSTGLWQAHPDVMGAVIQQHDDLIDASVSAAGGWMLKSRGEGDATFCVFGTPSNAARAALDIQRRSVAHGWPAGIDLRVRIALHTGEAEGRDGDYFGTTVNRCARLRGIAHGGQTICSAATASLIEGTNDVTLRDLGIHALRDVDRPERVFQLSDGDDNTEFPPLNSLTRSMLRAPRTTFVGREDERRALAQLLAGVRLVTLTGVGGSGKTRLATCLADAVGESFPDGRYFVEFAPVTAADAATGAVWRALGALPGSASRIDQLTATLSHKRSLLVFDNCEHIIDACAELAEQILDECPHVRILATSREALGITGERVYAVQPLSTMPRAVEPSEAAALFCDRAASVRSGFRLTAENRADVEELCRRLDGLPLAIELAAAQVLHLTPAEIMRRLDARLTTLTGGRGREHRQRTLAATLDWSYELLSDEEQSVLRHLAVFVGSFTLDGVLAVCGERDASQALGGLVAKSLVATHDEGRSTRYHLLETVRLYAAEHLQGANEDAEARTRHRDYYLGWLDGLPTEFQIFGDDTLGDERDNLRAALQWSAEQGRTDLVARMATRMYSIWDCIDPVEGVHWLTIGFDALDDLETGERVRLLLARSLAAIIELDGDFAAARGHLERAVELVDDRPDSWASGAYALLCLLESTRAFEGHAVRDRCENLARRALELAPDAGARQYALTWLGHARAAINDLDGAIEASERAMEDLVTVKAGWIPVHTVYLAAVLSVLCHLVGDLDRAAMYAEMAAGTSLFPGANMALYASLPRALVLATRRDFDGARQLIRDDFARLGKTAVPGTLPATAVTLGVVAALQEDWPTAAELLGAARAAFDQGLARNAIDVMLYLRYGVKTLDALGPDALTIASRTSGTPLASVVAKALQMNMTQTPRSETWRGDSNP